MVRIVAMDETLIASFRKSLESKTTQEIRAAQESGQKSGSSPEQLEAMRQILEERQSKSNRFAFAVASGLGLGAVGATAMWWRGGDETLIAVGGLVGAFLGFASWYVPDLMPRG